MCIAIEEHSISFAFSAILLLFTAKDDCFSTIFVKENTLFKFLLYIWAL